MDHRRRSPWQLVGRLAPVLVLLVLAAPQASAGCGDHVQILPPAAAAIQAKAADGAPRNPLPFPTSPCGHGKCDRAPAAPMPPAPPTAPLGGPQHDVILFAVLTPIESPEGAAHPADTGDSPRDPVTAIFHPPRV